METHARQACVQFGRTNLASSIDLRQLDLCSATAEHAPLGLTLEQLASTRAVISNAAGRPHVATIELATHHSIVGEAARLSRSGSAVR